MNHRTAPRMWSPTSAPACSGRVWRPRLSIERPSPARLRSCCRGVTRRVGSRGVVRRGSLVPGGASSGAGTNGPPRVTINPNDRMMRLRSYFPGGDEEMKATEWAACEAFVKPGRHLQPVEDVDAQLNIGLDSDEEGTGAKKKEFDAKKDKGLVGRPGRLDNIFNAAVVSGRPPSSPTPTSRAGPNRSPSSRRPRFRKKAKVGLALGFKPARTTSSRCSSSPSPPSPRR